MEVTIKDNLLYIDGEKVAWKESPNQGGNIVAQYLIEHYTNDYNKGQAVSWLANKESGVSAHLVIEQDGSVTQMVKFNKRAFHAGKSYWDGIEGLNSFSIGIEIVNIGRLTEKDGKYFFGKHEVKAENVIKATHKNETSPSYWEKYPAVQMDVVKAISKALVEFYNLKDIIGHDDISPNRKSDPGPAFPMTEVKGQVEFLSDRLVSTNINFRLGGSVNDKVMEVIPKGQVITELVRQGDWSRISWNGKLGWVNNKYLKDI